VLVAAYWYLGKALDVHQSKVLGGVFEVLWCANDHFIVCIADRFVLDFL